MCVDINAQGEVEILSGSTTLEHFDRTQSFETLDFASQTTTLKLIQGNVLQKETKEASVSLHDSESDQKSRHDRSIYRQLSTEQSNYDTNGIETYRECRDYMVDNRRDITQNEMWLFYRQADILGGRPENFKFKIETSFPRIGYDDENPL